MPHPELLVFLLRERLAMIYQGKQLMNAKVDKDLT